MKLPELPPKPAPNGDREIGYLVEAVEILTKHAEHRSRFFKMDLDLGNIMVIGGMLCTLLFFYVRGESHLASVDTEPDKPNHIHWTPSQLDQHIDQRDAVMQRALVQRLDDYIASMTPREFTDYKASTSVKLDALQQQVEEVKRTLVRQAEYTRNVVRQGQMGEGK